jgi:hypothetical protein
MSDRANLVLAAGLLYWRLDTLTRQVARGGPQSAGVREELERLQRCWRKVINQYSRLEQRPFPPPRAGG